MNMIYVNAFFSFFLFLSLFFHFQFMVLLSYVNFYFQVYQLVLDPNECELQVFHLLIGSTNAGKNLYFTLMLTFWPCTHSLISITSLIQTELPNSHLSGRLLHLFCVDSHCCIQRVALLVILLWFYSHGYVQMLVIGLHFFLSLQQISLSINQCKYVCCSLPQNSPLCYISSTFVILVCFPFN